MLSPNKATKQRQPTMHITQKQNKSQRQKSINDQKIQGYSDRIHAVLTSSETLAIIEAQQPDYRERYFTPTLTLSVFLQQALDADGSCQAAVNRIVAQQLEANKPVQSAGTGAYCRARQRLPLSLVSGLTRHIGGKLSKAASASWRWKNRHIKLIDGTTLSMPDTLENQARYPQPGTQKEGVGFPLARAVAIIARETGALLNFALGPWRGKKTGEHGLLREMLDNFEVGDLVMGDAYYSSYWLIADLMSRGVDMLMESHGAREVDFRKGTRLGKKDHVMQWIRPKVRPSWMTKEEYNAYPEQLTVREIYVGKKVLVTTLLSAKLAPRDALKTLYHERWGIELRMRDIKETLGMGVLRCKTPDMVEKEIWVHLLAYNLIRVVMSGAAAQAKTTVHHISFKHTVQFFFCIRLFDAGMLLREGLFWHVIAQIRVGQRPGRMEPRCVKRRPKAYQKMKKPRAELQEEISKNGRSQQEYALK